MTTATALAVGDIYVRASLNTGYVTVREIIRMEGDIIVYAETFNATAQRRVGYLPLSGFKRYTYAGSVRLSSDRVNHVEDGDLFVYTYMDPHSADIAGNTFVLEVTHAYVPGDPDGVRGNVHMTDGFIESDALPPLRFERAHLRDFQYCGKIDNGTRDGMIKASVKPSTEDVPHAPADKAADEATE